MGWSWAGGVPTAVTEGKLVGMQENDREHPDDETVRTQHADAHAQQAPVIRMLANPRRVRRA